MTSRTLPEQESGESTMAPQTPPGWYRDPGGMTRWWDGQRWPDHLAPGPTPTASGVVPPPMPPDAPRQLADLQAQIASANEMLAYLRAQLVDVRNTYSLQEVGLYDYVHPAETSATL